MLPFTAVIGVLLQTQSAVLPPYHPRHLQPVAWPAGSSTPGAHAGDVTYATLSVSGHKLGVFRAASEWGTGVAGEDFMLLQYHAGWTLDSIEELPFERREQFWDALSFRGNWADAATGDKNLGHWVISACLFVADDSLLVYGVYPDSSAGAKDFLTPEELNKNGFYRVDPLRGTMTKVASLAPDFEWRCRQQADQEGRGRSEE